MSTLSTILLVGGALIGVVAGLWELRGQRRP